VEGIGTVERGSWKHKIDPEPVLADLNLVIRDPAAFPEIKTGGLMPVTPGTFRR
jgi:hypothetical protein